MRRISVFTFIVLFVVTVAVSAAEFREVSAEPLRIRDGIGNTLEKLSKGETVRVAYLGGSITAASGCDPKQPLGSKRPFRPQR